MNDLEASYQRALLAPLIGLALDHVEPLSAPAKADIYDAIRAITAQCDPAVSEQAKLTCDALREAERSQMSFRELMRATLNL